MTPLVLDGRSLTIEDLAQAAVRGRPLDLDPAGFEEMARARRLIDRMVDAERSDAPGAGPIVIPIRRAG